MKFNGQEERLMAEQALLNHPELMPVVRPVAWELMMELCGSQSHPLLPKVGSVEYWTV
jgi:hypothetical protein